MEKDQIIAKLQNKIIMLDEHIKDQREDKRRYEEMIDYLSGYNASLSKRKHLTITYRNYEKPN